MMPTGWRRVSGNASARESISRKPCRDSLPPCRSCWGGGGNSSRGGESLGEPRRGSPPAMPLLLGREPLHGRKLVYCTTNGTIALRAAAGASFAYVGALLNGAGVTAHIRKAH